MQVPQCEWLTLAQAAAQQQQQQQHHQLLTMRGPGHVDRKDGRAGFEPVLYCYLGDYALETGDGIARLAKLKQRGQPKPLRKQQGRACEPGGRREKIYFPGPGKFFPGFWVLWPGRRGQRQTIESTVNSKLSGHCPL